MNNYMIKKSGWMICLLLFGFTVAAQQRSYKNLVMEGGGVRGFAYAGALQILDSLDLLQDIERVGGTSAGAIQAVLLAVGYTPEEIMEIASKVPLKKFNDGAWFFGSGLRRLKKKFGWYKGDKFQQWIAALIEAKTGDADISFETLHRLRDEKGYKDLYVTGTDITWQKLVVFSYESFPSMRIQDAVRVSMSIPFFYKAVLMDDNGNIYNDPVDSIPMHVMVDGGVLSNYPLFLFDSTKYREGFMTGNQHAENPETLGLLMEIPEQIEYNRHQAGNGPFVINNINSYWKALYRTVIDRSNPDATGQYQLRRTIAIDNLNLSGRVRKLPKATVEALMESGRKGVRDFFK